MSVPLHTVLAATASLAVGTWLGLGRPTAEDARARVEAALVLPPPRIPPPQIASDTRPNDFEPLPEQASAPAQKPWPELNAEASIQRAWLVSEGPYHPPGDPHRLVTLTFDDGPFLETTPKVLKLLARHRIHATFFVIGQYLDGSDRRAAVTRKLLNTVLAQGHLVGNHTHDHARLTTRSQTQVLEQIDQGAASIERATGRRPILFRPPYGELDAFGERAVQERGLDLALWNIAVNDMTRDDSHQMFREITSALDYKEGGMVLLHDIRFSSVAVLRELLPWLEEHKWDPKRPERVGYEVVDLPTYLRAAAASPQPYSSRDEIEKVREQRSRLRHIKATPGEG